MKIAIIPARIGSKRIHKKNIKLFCDKPMITYPIKTALDSKIFDKVIVSTDSEEIAEVARISGAEVPFLRPKSLANDDTATIPVINHVIKNLEDGSDFIDKVCCIYPCSPLLSVGDLINSLELMLTNKSNSCIPVCEFSSAPQRGFKIDKKQNLQWVNPNYKNIKTQDLQKLYHDIGSFYWASKEQWLEGDISNALAYIIPNWRVVDIDNHDDWLRAEIMYKILNSSAE